MKKLFILLAIVVFFGMDSCKKKSVDPDYCAGQWSTELSAEIATMFNAALAYDSNPNTTTCNAYKASIQAYISGLQKFSECSVWTADQKASLNEAITESQTTLANACSN